MSDDHTTLKGKASQRASDPCSSTIEKLIEGVTHDPTKFAVDGVHCAGGIAIFGDSRGGTGVGRDVEVHGNIVVHGDISLTSAADCAEDFDLTGSAVPPPGTVMVLADEGALCPSTFEYDRRVAGIISGAGDCKPGITLDRRK